MKKLLTILLVLISFSSFAQFEAGEFVNSDTVKIDGDPLLLNTFKQGNLGGAGEIFYSTGASSQPASGSVTDVVGNNYIQNQNTSAQTANMWISGKSTSGGVVTSGTGQGFKNYSYQAGYNRIWSFGSGAEPYGMGYYQGGTTLTSGVYIPDAIGFHLGDVLQPFLWVTNTNTVTSTGNITAPTFQSTIPTGTAPLVVASTTKVDNLNVEMLDGQHASDFQLKSDTLTFDATISDLNDSTASIRALANTKATISGTDNYIMKKTGANMLGNSSISEDALYNYFGKPAYFLKGFDVSRMSTADLQNNKTANSGILTNSGYGMLNKDSTALAYDGWWHIINMHHNDNNGFNAQIIAPLSSTDPSLHWRNSNNGIWSDWKTILSDNGAGLWGFGTTTPAARVHSQSTTTQLRLGYDATKYTDLSTESTGNLTIDPTGDTTKVVGAVNSTGGFFKNGVEITGGGGMVYPPAGVAVSTGTGWETPSGNVGFDNWNLAYQDRITAASFSGSTTKTLTLTQQDGGTLTASFTDLSSGGSMTWPSQAGIAVYSGSNSWSTSKAAPSGTIVGTTDSQVLTNKSVNGVTLSTAQGTTNFLRGDGTYAAPSGGSGMVYPGAGIPVSTGSSWGTSKTSPSGAIVGTTDSQALTNKSINGVTLSTGAGSSNYLAGDGTYKNLSTVSQWTNVTGGILYENGVRIGNTSYTSAKLNVTATDRAIQGESDSNQGIYGGSNSGNGVYGVSSTGVGVYGNSTTGFGGLFEGLGCKSTKYYVSSLNTAPASSSATGTTGEIRICSTGIYICIATNTWIRQLFSTW